MQINRFKTSFAERIYRQKYAQGPNDTWDALAERLVEDVCGTRWGKERALMSDEDRQQLVEHIITAPAVQTRGSGNFHIKPRPLFCIRAHCP